MSKELRYKFEDQIRNGLEIRMEAYDHASQLPPDVRKDYLKAINSFFSTRNMKEKFQAVYGPIIGLIILISCLVIAFIKPFPSRFQTGTFWGVMSVAAAISTYAMTGFMELNIPKFVRAGGSFAVLCLFYLFVPKMSEKIETPGIDKLILYIVPYDTLNLQKLSPEFDKNNSVEVPVYAAKSLSNYYGRNIPADEFTCYRKSDGKIYGKEECKEITEYELLMISNKIVGLYPDKHQAYLHFVTHF